MNRGRSIALVDLMALVVGIATALVLPGDAAALATSRPPQGDGITLIVKGLYPGAPLLSLRKLDALSGLAAVALVPVVVARRWRGGGGFGPAGWLLIALASRFAHGQIEAARSSHWDPRWLGDPAARVAWERAWDGTRWAGFGIVGFCSWASRGRLPTRWRLPILAALPLFTLWGPLDWARGGMEAIWAAVWPDVDFGTPGRMAYAWLMELPGHLVVALPLAAAIDQVARHRGRDGTRPGTAGLAIAATLSAPEVMLVIGHQAVDYLAIAGHRLDGPAIAARLGSLAISGGGWLADAMIALAMIRRAGRDRAEPGREVEKS